MTNRTAPTATEALDALKHSGAEGGWDDFDQKPTAAFLTQYAASKDGENIVIKMTPEQVLRFVDMIAEELD